MIDILLATYNGEKFLRELLDSILIQSFQDWCLLVHDDGSSDNTLSILHEYQDNHPDKITILEDGKHFGNASKNFAHLMGQTKADYIMLCDQDDVWMPDKIDATFSTMKWQETLHPEQPVLVHTDLTIVDEKLNVLAPSMFTYQRLNKRSKLLSLLVRNNVTGCTVMVNRRALVCALPIPDAAMMHDWWLVLKVQDQGTVFFLDRPTVYYRQHGSNCLGAVEVNFKYFLMNSRFFSQKKAGGQTAFNKVLIQAKALNSQLPTWKLYVQRYWVLFLTILFLERFKPKRDTNLFPPVMPITEAKDVVILLSTYNGCAYLRDQIRSIKNQSLEHWVLLIRDDGSTDETYELLQEVQQQDDHRIQVLPKGENIGVIQSFSSLAEEGLKRFPKVDYFMFADQDDIWLPFKVSETLNVMLELEKKIDYVLVHTDLKVVNRDLKEIALSFMKFQGIRHEYKYALNVLLTQNFVTGCTIMANRALLQTAVPVAHETMMHDWWLALCAASLGEIGFVTRPTIKYRQHQDNSIGAKGLWGTLRRALLLKDSGLSRQVRFQKIQAQANALLLFLETEHSGRTIQIDLIKLFVSLDSLSWFQRIFITQSLHIYPQFLVRRYAFWLDLLRLERK